tara:strand:+ start:918 stop:1076 length:159 start_codon:yes stop_codon:yes gene_type:complete
MIRDAPPITTAPPIRIMGVGLSPRISILEIIVNKGSMSMTGITFETGLRERT